MCAGWGNEALIDAELTVTGPSGSGSDTAGGYDFDDYECAEVETIKTLTIAYTLTAPGTHTVYMSSYAAVASWWAGVDVDDFAEDLLTFEVAIPVDIDIKPGSDPNAINLGSNGVIPVAILGSDTFHVADIDPSTVLLEGASLRLKGKSGNYGSFEDVNNDGHTDLVVHIVDFSVVSGATEATLTGNLGDGTAFAGSDSIYIVPPE